MSEQNYWSRKSRRRRFMGGAGALGAGLAGVALVGCGDDDDDKGKATSAATSAATGAASASASATGAASASATAAVKKGGTLSVNGVGNLDAPHLDVHQTATLLLMSYGPGMAYSRVVRYKVPPETALGWNAEIEMDLAASAEQPDPTTVVVKVRPNAKFHNVAPVNGRNATAQDILYSFKRQTDLKVNASLLPPWDSMEATDPMTLRFKLKAPNADFLATLASYANKVIAKEAVDAGKGGDLKEGPTIGTGPWILEEWKAGQQTKFKKNPDYFIAGLPYLDNYLATRIGDPSTAFAAVKTGQINRVQTGITQQQIDEIKGDKNVVPDSYRQYGNAFLNFKMDVPPFNDPRVRQAVYRAINYDQMNEVGVFGAGYVTGGISMPALDWELPEADLKARYKQDVNAAKQLLQAAGQANLSAEIGFLNQPPNDKLVQLMQQQLKAIGIDLKLVPLDNVGYAANALSPANKYALMFGTSSPASVPTTDIQPKFATGGSRNASLLKDAKLDELIDKQSALLEKNARKAALLDLQKYFHDNYYQWALGILQQSVLSSFVRGAKGVLPQEPDAWTRVWLDK